MTAKRAPFAAACAAMFLFGIVLAILGALFGLPAMRQRLAIDLAQQGDILLLLFLGVLVSTLLVGPTIDRFGNRIVLTASAAVVTAALAILSAAHSFTTAVAASALLGFGGGGLNTSANALVADLFPDNRAPRLNIVAMFYGVGALFIPLLMAAAAGLLAIPQLLLTAGALAAFCTVAFLAVPFPEPQEAAGFSLLASLKAARIPGVLPIGLILFFESGNESSIGGWLSTYAGSTGAPPRIATAILTCSWIGLTVGRLLGASILERVSKSRVVVACAIGSAIGAAAILATSSVAAIAAGAVIAGLSFGPIYPTMLAVAADRYQRNAGTIFGLLFAMGLAGGMLFPWLIGRIGENHSLRSAMALPLIGAIAIAAIASFIRSRYSPPPS